MERWDREALYAEAWEQPLTKLATKYGISNVMLAKVCRKLKIPVPGRGYWAKQRFGKAVTRVPLPVAKNLPVLHRFEHPVNTSHTEAKLEPEPTDEEYVQIKEIEGCPLAIDSGSVKHKLIVISERILRKAHPDSRGILQANWECLDIRVSKDSLDRALAIMNAVIMALERMEFKVNIQREQHNTRAQVFGYIVPFAMVEKYREKSRREVQLIPSLTKWEIEYQPTGKLEFRVGQDRWHVWHCRDNKRKRLEEMLPAILGAIMREGRERLLEAERNKQQEIERWNKEIELLKLRDEIAAEEKKVAQLEAWVTAWVRACQMREFIVELEKVWIKQGHNLSPEGEKGQRIEWMRQQADRLDPLVYDKP